MPTGPYPETRVVAVGTFNSTGKLLLGLRKDVLLYTCPGGHLEDGEAPARGAIRELHEEAGLIPHSLTYLGDGLVRLAEDRIIRVYCFRADIPDGQYPHSTNDPDDECSQWHWVDVGLGSLPLQYDRHLYHPNDVLLKYLGLQRGTVQTSEDQFPSIADDDYVKVILEVPGQAPKPIEGHHKFVYFELLTVCPWARDLAPMDDVEGLATAINSVGPIYISFGDELNAPRHRYAVEQYDPAVHDDPWIREEAFE